MVTNAPKSLTLWVSVVLAVLGLLGSFEAIPFVTAYAFWFVVAGFVLLLLGCLVKGL
jgi:predicted membrane channel-forming protein YqfA (hemolysin III family)